MIQTIIALLTPIADASINNKNDTLDILSKVYEFYDSAWDKLIYLVSGAFGILAVLVPYLIQRYQNKVLDLKEKELERKIIEEVEKARNEIKKEMLKIFNNKIEEFDKKIQKSSDEVNGKIFHLNGSNHYDKEEYLETIRSFCCAISHYIDCDEKSNLKVALESISYSLGKLNEDQINDLKFENYCDLDDLCQRIERKSYYGFLYKDIVAIRKKIKSLQE